MMEGEGGGVESCCGGQTDGWASILSILNSHWLMYGVSSLSWFPAHLFCYLQMSQGMQDIDYVVSMYFVSKY